MFTEIQTKSKDFAQNQNGWFFNDSGKIVKKFSQMQNLGQLGPEYCRAYVFFAWCVWVCVCVCVCVCFFFCVCFCFCFCFFFFPSFFFSFFLFSPFFSFFLFFFLLIAWSKFALQCDIPYCTISVSKIQNFQLLRGHIPLRHPLCVQACNWRWRSTKSSPNVEDGCTALCSFGVLAVVKCCKQCFIAMFFFLLLLFLYINSRLFHLSL